MELSSDTLAGVSVVICTKDRSETLLLAVEAVLQVTSPPLELLVLDQSGDEQRQKTRAALPEDPRLRYVESGAQGKSAALNEAVCLARFPILAVTDDDCFVEANWLNAHLDAYAANPEVGVVFGSVLAVKYDTAAGFIPVYNREAPFLCDSLGKKLRARGIGANLSFRKKTHEHIGGFDECLGPGASAYSNEEGDFAVRALLKAHFVFETPDSIVRHAGFRTWEQGKKITRQAFFGIGAAYIKPIRAGKFSVLTVLGGELFRHALLPALTAALTLKKPFHWGRVVSFVSGMAYGLKTPLDKASLCFIPNPPSPKSNP